MSTLQAPRPTHNHDSRKPSDNTSIVTPPRPSSPTPSELEDADTTPFGFKSFFSSPGKKSNPWFIIIAGLFVVLFIVIMALKSKIVNAIQPAAKDLRNLDGGWAIPIAIMIVISFPPLFGHEIIAIMVGVVWGIWKGFLIVAAGTLLGEIANFFVFRTLLSKRAAEYERHRLAYACLARVVRDGGFLAILIIRYSAIPGHLSTVVFSVTGISFFVYVLAAVLSLPKQLITVFLGYSANKGSTSKLSRDLSIAVIVIGTLITIVAARWVFAKMTIVRPEVVAERRARRAENGTGTGYVGNGSGHSARPTNNSPGGTNLGMRQSHEQAQYPAYAPPSGPVYPQSQYAPYAGQYPPPTGPPPPSNGRNY